MKKLGVALGAGALAGGLAACGDRAIGDNPDMTQMAGVAPPMEARVDTTLDSGIAGGPPPPDAKIDSVKRDTGSMDDTMTMGGVAPPMDALLDEPKP